MIIDFHVHCFPDTIAKRAISHLAQVAKVPPRLDGTILQLKQSMKMNNILCSVVQNIATKPSQTMSINNWAAQNNSIPVFSFGSLHPENDDWKEELSRIKELGLKGIKLHPDYQVFFVDDSKMLKIYEEAFRLGLIILFHAGVDIGLEPPYHCTPDRLAKVVSLFPEAVIIAAHMGGYEYWEKVLEYLVGTTVYMDTSYSLGHIDKSLFLKIIASHDSERILFATDSPWKDQGEEINKIKDLNLNNEIKDKIFYRNAAKLLSFSTDILQKKPSLKNS